MPVPLFGGALESLRPRENASNNDALRQSMHKEISALRSSLSIPTGQTSVVATPQQLASFRRISREFGDATNRGQTQSDARFAALEKRARELNLPRALANPDSGLYERDTVQSVTLTREQFEGLESLEKILAPAPPESVKAAAAREKTVVEVEQKTHEALQGLRKTLPGMDVEFQGVMKAINTLSANPNQARELGLLVTIGVFFIYLTHMLEERGNAARNAKTISETDLNRANIDLVRAKVEREKVETEILRKTGIAPTVPVVPTAPRRYPPYSPVMVSFYERSLQDVAVQELGGESRRTYVQDNLTMNTNEQGDVVCTISVELHDRLYKANPQTQFHNVADGELHGFTLQPKRPGETPSVFRAVIRTDDQQSRDRFDRLFTAAQGVIKRNGTVQSA